MSRILTDTDRQKLLKLAVSGVKQTDIAKRFGISPSTVSHLLKDLQKGNE